MIPQISKREIGKVVIVDIKGELSGPWALRGREAFKQMIDGEEDQKLVFNLQELTGLDSLGFKSLLETKPSDKEIGILFPSPMVMDMVNHFSGAERVRTFLNEEELISEYGVHLVLNEDSNGAELRKIGRLQTALPVEFSYEEDGRKVEFRAIATNLSVGGLFAEYIDLKTVDQTLERINPYDLRDLDLKLMLSKKTGLNLKGTVVHRRLHGEQVGVGIRFADIDLEKRKAIASFLESVQSQNRNHDSKRKEGK